MQDSNSENPYQSTAGVHEEAAGSPNAAIWGTVAVAVVFSAGSLIVHPLLSIFVAIMSAAAIGRTWILVKRRSRLSQTGENMVLLTVGGSFALMGLLVFASLVVGSVLEAPLIFLSGFLFSSETITWARPVVGYSVRGLLFGYGYWYLLRQPELPEKNPT